jgi:hypothetical protein
MQTISKIDLDYRPQTYWPDSLTPGQLISQIQGKVRQDMAMAIYDEQGFTGLDAFIAREELSEAERNAWGAMDPSCLGGEYLPSREPGEVEIARVSLASVTSDQISIRAYRKNAKIRYRIVGEYEELIYTLAFEESDQPLTIRELMKLIDGSYIPDCIYEGGILTTMWVMLFTEGYDDAEVARYVSVSSAFYPDLQRYYDELVAAWLEPRRREEQEEELLISTNFRRQHAIQIKTKAR